MLSSSVLSVLLSIFVKNVSTTTEWWGDLRAHMNPPRAPAFYDVSYDDISECAAGLRADAIPDYVYFGTMIATFTVDQHDQCLRRCLDKPKCKSVNFFYPLAYQEKAFCELLSETQHDNPRLLRPFHRAFHFEKIRCKEIDDILMEDDAIPHAANAVASPAGTKSFTSTPATTTASTKSSAPALSTKKSTASSTAPVKQVVGIPRPQTAAEQKHEISALMKKLSAKVAEFNSKGIAPFRA